MQYAMNHKPVIPAKQDDVAGFGVFGRTTVELHNIAWKQCRQHAAAGDAQPQLTGGEQRLCCYLKSAIYRIFI